MSTSMHSFLSAVVALILLALLTAPGVDVQAPVERATDVRTAASSLSAECRMDEAQSVMSRSFESGKGAVESPFIKPHVSTYVVAERGFDDAATSVPYARAESPRHVASDIESCAFGHDTRRAVLHVYRL